MDIKHDSKQTLYRFRSSITNHFQHTTSNTPSSHTKNLQSHDILTYFLFLYTFVDSDPETPDLETAPLL